MRSKIFSPLERRLLNEFITGEPVSGNVWTKLRWRFKTFNLLAEDVALYTKVRAALAEY